MTSRELVTHKLALAETVSVERLGEPKTNRAMFSALAAAGWIEPSMAETMSRVVGFRNVLVHGYADVDIAVVRDVAEHRLDDLLSFVEAMQTRLANPG